MSYYFKMTFKEIKQKDMLDYCINLMKYDYEHAEEIIEKNGFYIPSIKEGYEELDYKQYKRSKWKIADRNWLYKILSKRFIYWSEKNLLGIIGDVGNDFDEDMVHITFQNSTDQDYPFEQWKGIGYFEEVCEKYRNYSKEDMEALLNSWYGIDEEFEEECNNDPDYFRKSAIYREIYNGLELDNWLWNEKGSFELFTMCALNYEDEYDIFIMLEQTRQRKIKELQNL